MLVRLLASTTQGVEPCEVTVTVVVLILYEVVVIGCDIAHATHRRFYTERQGEAE